MKLILFCTYCLTTAAFIPSPNHSFHPKTSKHKPLSAESGPPKYDKIDGIIRSSEELAEGSVMLHIDVADEKTKLEYKPGHVIALEIQESDDKWLIGPYTISRSTESSMDVLIKVVGKKSQRLANCEKDTPIKFGGKFKVPILDGISESVKRIVLISTGVGVGPMVGAIETALEHRPSAYPPIELFALYRTPSDVIYKEYLDELSAANPSRFQWSSIISDDSGRLSSTNNLKRVFNGDLGMEDTHYHLIGNAQMVKEWQAGIVKAGVSESKVTIEQYFNHKAQIDHEVVDRIAEALTESCSVKG